MKNTLLPTAFLAFALLPLSVSASDTSKWEFSAHFGQSWASDLDATQSDGTVAIDDGNNVGLAIAWHDSPNGLGQVMLNLVSHDYVSDIDQQSYNLDISYLHFNGVALFKQASYVTTVALGLGGAQFDTSFNEKFYPSATVAIGTRYEFSNNLSFITELRAYGSLVDEEDKLFCQGDNCHARFESSLWVETNISIGIAYRF